MTVFYALCTTGRPSTSHKDTTMIRCILTYSKGFICSGGSGTLHMFEKTDNRNIYKKVRPVSILEEAISSVGPSDGGIGSTPIDNSIVSMTISPSEETVVCSTVSQQIYSFTLSTADMGEVYIQAHSFMVVYINQFI